VSVTKRGLSEPEALAKRSAGARVLGSSSWTAVGLVLGSIGLVAGLL